uniref:Uncharacterized protein n=1 Tax=Anguilla anguilla TaxID=7936 RepID=A0A0E9SE96_ANGAN
MTEANCHRTDSTFSTMMKVTTNNSLTAKMSSESQFQCRGFDES